MEGLLHGKRYFIHEEAVTAALDEYIRPKQMQILDLFGTVDYHEDYDFKANRRRDRIENER